MDKASLMRFLKRILESGSAAKSAASLGQLLDILRTQNAAADMLRLVEDALESVPEAKEAAASPRFSEEELKIAVERARKRKRWEEEMANRGRCG